MQLYIFLFLPRDYLPALLRALLLEPDEVSETIWSLPSNGELAPRALLFEVDAPEIFCFCVLRDDGFFGEIFA